jgi:hypothetical protein
MPQASLWKKAHARGSTSGERQPALVASWQRKLGCSACAPNEAKGTISPRQVHVSPHAHRMSRAAACQDRARSGSWLRAGRKRGPLKAPPRRPSERVTCRAAPRQQKWSGVGARVDRMASAKAMCPRRRGCKERRRRRSEKREGGEGLARLARSHVSVPTPLASGRGSQLGPPWSRSLTLDCGGRR